MTHTRFLLRRHLAKSPPEVHRLEVRIVAESTAAACLARDASRDFPAFNDLSSAVAVGRGAHVARPPVYATLQTSQQQRIVRVVQRLAPQVGPVAPPLAVHARRAAKRFYLESGI